MAELHSKAALEGIDKLTHIHWCQISNSWQKLKISRWGSGLALHVCVCVFVQMIPRHLSGYMQACTQFFIKHKVHLHAVCVCVCVGVEMQQGQGSRLDASTPDRTQLGLSHTCQIHQAAQKFHGKKKKKRTTQSYRRWTLTVSENHCVCLLSPPDSRRKTTKSKKKKVCVSTQTQETRLPIP